MILDYKMVNAIAETEVRENISTLFVRNTFLVCDAGFHWRTQFLPVSRRTTFAA